MTTIAYRDGCMAADTGASRGSTIYEGVRKIGRSGDGTLVGAAGSAVYMAAVVAWADGSMAGDRPEAKEDDEGCDVALIAYPDGRLEVCEPGGSYFISAEYCSIGSGRDQAMGAMFAGADASTAVSAAIRHDAWTNGGVTLQVR